MENYKIGFVGFGHMAQILFQRLVYSNLIKKNQVIFTDKQSKIKKISSKFDIEAGSVSEINKQCRLVLICVPPQSIHEVARTIEKNALKENLYISILTGTKIESLQSILGKDMMVMRALPNVASTIGEGITPLCFNKACTVEIKTLGMLLFTSLGIVVEISEKLMDVASGICGCLPAYVFKIIDEIAKLGVDEGLSYEMSLKLTAQAFAGSAKIVQNEKSIDELLKSIMTPDGAVEAGLKTLEKLNVTSNLRKTVKTAIQRSSELSSI